MTVTGTTNQEAAAKPLQCGFCGARLWNDETACWIPLRGDHRVPYCADVCARWVVTAKDDYPNEVVLPEIFAHTAKLAEELRAARSALRRLHNLAADSLNSGN